MHQPSVRVLRQLSDALNLSAEILLTQAGLIDRNANGGTADEMPGVEHAIRTDEALDDAQKAALLAVYQSMIRPPQAAE
jgi:hypothetical protein